MANWGPWVVLFLFFVFCYGLWTKNGFYIFRGLSKKKQKPKKNVWQRAYGPQCLKYLLSSHLQKKFANPRCTLNRFLFFLVGLGTPFPSPIGNNASWKNAFLTCNRWTWYPPSSWAGDCLCLFAFFVPKAVSGAGEEASSLLTMTKGCNNNPQAHWNFLCSLCILRNARRSLRC